MKMNEKGLELWVEQDYELIRDILIPRMPGLSYIDKTIEGPGDALMESAYTLMHRATGDKYGDLGVVSAYRAVHFAYTAAAIVLRRPPGLTAASLRKTYSKSARFELESAGEHYLQDRPALRALVSDIAVPQLDPSGRTERPIRALAGLTFNYLDTQEQSRPVEEQEDIFSQALDHQLLGTVAIWQEDIKRR